ncbi:ROK family transcriptional regulator [Salinicola lusitanus]|uniref:ROK family transcriptional regulator n=1 Tax=Salinicola lusitanus TaxID=1949085 RepID=A0ABZ3CVS2_9GAMM
MLTLQIRRLLTELLLRGPMPRSQLAANVGINPSTVTRLTQQLIDARYLREGEALIEKRQPGRRAIELHLCADEHFVIGIAINAYQQTVAVANLTGTVLARRGVSRSWSPDPRASLSALATAAREALSECGIALDQVVATGVACAGQVDPTGRRVESSPDIGWFQIPVAEWLEASLGPPVFVETMQNALNSTECAFGAAAGTRSSLLVSVALGIGSSLIVDGKVVRARSQTLASMGHMPVAGVEALCNCGRRGCLNTVASGYAVLRRLGSAEGYERPQQHSPALASRLFEVLACAASDSTIAYELERAGEQLGEALKSSIVIASPERIALSGPVAQMESYQQGVRQALSPNERDPFGWDGELTVVSTRLEDAAARLALHRQVFLAEMQA